MHLTKRQAEVLREAIATTGYGSLWVSSGRLTVAKRLQRMGLVRFDGNPRNGPVIIATLKGRKAIEEKDGKKATKYEILPGAHKGMRKVNGKLWAITHIAAKARPICVVCNRRLMTGAGCFCPVGSQGAGRPHLCLACALIKPEIRLTLREGTKSSYDVYLGDQYIGLCRRGVHDSWLAMSELEGKQANTATHKTCLACTDWLQAKAMEK